MTQRRTCQLPLSGGGQGKNRRTSFLAEEVSLHQKQECENKTFIALKNLRSREVLYDALKFQHTELEGKYDALKTSFMNMAWEFCVGECVDFDYIPQLQPNLQGRCKDPLVKLTTNE